jgi:hypothetical protein
LHASPSQPSSSSPRPRGSGFRPAVLISSLALLLIAAAAGAAHGQAVTGRVLGAEDGQPLQGVFVMLLGEGGRRHAATITNPEGRYLLRLSEAGQVRVQAERIGFETATSPLLDPGTGTVVYDFTVAARAVELPAIAVETGSRGCARREDGPAVQALWQEVRKALDVAAWTSQTGGIRYTTLHHVRDLDVTGAVLLSETRSPRVAAAVRPYGAARSPAELVRGGFVDRVDGDLILFGPDAEVLLSDEFLDAYCFGLIGGTAGEAGLGFEPVRRRRAGDLRGVLWVDRASAELRRLEYTYTSLPGEHARHTADGAIHFRRLPTGLWVVDAWRIRSPLIRRSINHAAGTRYGVREEGGTLLFAEQGSATLYRRDGSGTVAGHFTDLVHGPGRAGTVVYLSGTPHSAVTDSAGYYRIDDVPAGRYAVAFTDTWLQELQYPQTLDSVTVAADGLTRHDIATPTRAAILRRLCPGERAASGWEGSVGDGLLHGTATDPRTGNPLRGVEVRAEWTEAGTTFWRIGTTRTNGRYVLCWVPPSGEVRLRITTRAHRTAPVTVPAGDPFRRHDLY